jgi:two-component system, OmpR family, sensor histidine kinase MprB
MSLRARMGLFAGAAVAIAVIAVVLAAYAGTKSDLQGQLDQSLRSVAAPVLARAGGPLGQFAPGRGGGGGPGEGTGTGCGAGGDRDEGLGLDQIPPQAFGGAPGTFTLVCRNGSTYSPASNEYPIPVTARERATARSGQGQYFTDMDVSGHRIRVMVTGIGWRGALLSALPLTTVDNALANQLVLLLVIGVAGIILAAVFGILVARTALAPIARFTRQTESIALNPERIEHERLDVTGSDELARLARTFNQTLDALELSVQSQRNLVADASHELRTPIATIRANLQLMRDEELLSPEDRAALREDVIEELDELTALVADVVELARGGKPSGEPGDVRLDAIVRDALERARRRAPSITFGQRLEPTLVRGEGNRISRAVTNLLDNAAKWSREGGEVEVKLHGGVLTVRDHGPGFNEDDLPFVFDRFHRSKEARSKPGSGLGLAIVRQAAEAHGGFAEAANAPDGGAVLRVGFGPPLELEEVPAEPTASTRSGTD